MLLAFVALVLCGTFALVQKQNAHWRLYYKGLSNRFGGDLEAAIENYTQALSLQPRLAEAYYSRGNAWFALENYQAALEDYTQAIQLESDLSDAAYYNRGNAYHYLKNWQLAVEDYTQAICLNPNSAQAYGNRGYSRILLGHYQAAKEDFQQAMQLFLEQGDWGNYQLVAQAMNSSVSGGVAQMEKDLVMS